MPWDVDRVLYDFGMPMGPFAMSDLAGPRHRLVEGDDILVDDPRNPVRAGPARPEDGRRLLRLRREPQRASPRRWSRRSSSISPPARGSTGATISDQEILERCLYPMVNEGAKILEEGKAQRASDIDIVWINGYGWPVYRGGPMFWADTVGLDKVLAAMKRLPGRRWATRSSRGAAGEAGRRREGVRGRDLYPGSPSRAFFVTRPAGIRTRRPRRGRLQAPCTRRSAEARLERDSRPAIAERTASARPSTRGPVSRARRARPLWISLPAITERTASARPSTGASYTRARRARPLRDSRPKVTDTTASARPSTRRGCTWARRARPL